MTTALAGKVDDSQVLTNVPSGAVFTDTNTTYSVGDGGLTQKNFTTTLKTKLDGVAASANNYSLPATLPASMLTGALPAISGASLTNIEAVITQTTMPTGQSAGTLWFDTSTDGALYVHNGTDFVTVYEPQAALGTQENPAKTGVELYDSGVTTNGKYWIKPSGYSGSAIECFVWMESSSYGRGAVLVGSFANESGFRMCNYAGGKGTAANLNVLHTTQNNTTNYLLPKDFINQLAYDSTGNHTVGGVCAADGGASFFQYRSKGSPAKGCTDNTGTDLWKYAYYTGAANGNVDIRYYGRNSYNTASGHNALSFSFDGWRDYQSGRGCSDSCSGGCYHYMPDDFTGGGEWWFRENIYDSCHSAYGRGEVDNMYVW